MSHCLWQTHGMSVLALNAGSSSIRFALFEAGSPPLRARGGKIERIGHGDAQLSVVDAGAREPRAPVAVDGTSFGSAVTELLKWLESQSWFGEVEAVGHRVVHGMSHTAPQRATRGLLSDLKRIGALDPEHLPQEIQLVEAIGAKLPHLAQVLCFDTAFHRGMPRRATQLPIPRRYEALGIRRYGFHGLSYTYLMQELARLRDPHAAHGRVILAHLGSGASLAAVRDGRCIDTTMGFTPTGGLMMGTRSGDLDPGVLIYLAERERMVAPEFRRMLNHESGLEGRLRHERGRARSLEVRSRRCARCGGDRIVLLSREESHRRVRGRARRRRYAGVRGRHRRELARDSGPHLRRSAASSASLSCAPQNARNADVISDPAARAVTVRVIRTDEESVIAQLTTQVLDYGSAGEAR